MYVQRVSVICSASGEMMTDDSLDNAIYYSGLMLKTFLLYDCMQLCVIIRLFLYWFISLISVCRLQWIFLSSLLF